MQSHPFPWPRLVLAAAAIGFAIFLSAARLTPPTPPAPTPTPAPNSLDLRPVFVSSDAKADSHNAQLFGAICGRIACTLEADSKRGGDRRIITGTDVAQFRADLLFYAANGWRFSDQYKTLPAAVSAWLDSQVGTDPSELTADEVERWSAAFRALESAAKAAADSRAI